MTVCFIKWITLILFILVLPIVSAASQECLTDSGIYQDDPNNPYRSGLDTMYQQIDTGTKQSENFFTFSLNGTIESAEVMLYVDGVSGLNGNVEIQYWICNGTTDEAATTWNNWATYLDCGSNTIGDPVAWNWHTVGFDIFNVTEWFTNGSVDSSMFTIYVEVTGGTGAKWIRWAAREHLTAEHRPYLNYTLGAASFAVEPLAPKNGTHYNFFGNTTFNGSIIFNSSDIMSCWINYSDFTLQGTNLSTEIEFRNNTALVDGYYNVYYECNSTGNTDSGEINFYLDTNTPVITINNPANNSAFNADFLMNFSFTDLYLYKVNYTIYNSSNHVVGGNASGALPANTISYNFTDIFDVSAQGNGSYYVNISATDTHTKNSIDDIAFIKDETDNEKIVTFKLDGGDLQIKFPKQINVDMIKDVDRYRFKMSVANAGSTHNIKILSSQITYLADSVYPAHFIINERYWLDWLSDDLVINDVFYEDGFYKVQLTFNKENIISDSLGGLNEVSKQLNFIIDITPPNITFISQSPADIDSLNTIGIDVNISYDIEDETTLNETSIKLYYKTNTSDTDIFYFINGTAYSGYQTDIDDSNNNSLNYNWTLEDNQLYRGTYNLNEETYDDTAHTSLLRDHVNELVYTRFYNVSNTSQYNVVETMISREIAGSTSIEYYYCNSTYSTGTVTASKNCGHFYTHNPADYHHRHSANSAHVIAPMPINITSGTIVGVKISKESFIILRPTSTAGWNVWYIPNTTSTTTTATTSNGGVAWTPQTYTIDQHIHQFSNNDTFYYYVTACDNLNQCSNSTLRFDDIGLDDLPPSSPDILVPNSSIYSDIINITYLPAASPSGYNITFYNISLLDSAETFVQFIVNNSLNTNYTWDTNNAVSGQYKIRVDVCDTQNLCSYSLSELFVINNPIEWQYVTMNISNGSQINISLLNGYISSRFFSWNETPQTIDIWLNGTEYCSQSMANMTYLTPCDLTGLSFNTTYYGFSNTTYNTTYFWFEVTNTTRYTSSYDESDIFTGLALFILTNVALYVLMFFLITNMTVNVEKLVQKYEGQQPNHVVIAIKIDLAIKGAALACLTILNLIICGYTYYTSQEITAELANLAFPFFLFNVITSFSLLLMYVIKIFFFPFEYVRGLVADFDESMKK